jgi:hypothetical protein
MLATAKVRERSGWIAAQVGSLKSHLLIQPPEIGFCSTLNTGHSEARAGLPLFDPTQKLELSLR